jgi:RHS repeat-associated protein
VNEPGGARAKKTVNNTTESSLTTTEYAGNYIYEDGNLQFFNSAEGYVTPKPSGGYAYIYRYKDHLDNTRLSYVNIGSIGTPVLEIIEESNYYPFGLLQKGYNQNVSSSGNSIAQRYKFGGNELQEELNLNWYDITARNYNPELGRWMNLDPLADEMRRHSPYNYAFDNPIYYIDPDGMAPTDRWQKAEDGTLTWINNDGGDTTDYVDNVDENGNVVSTEVLSIETGESECSSCEVDTNLKLPGLRHKIKGTGDPRIEQAELDDAAAEVISFAGEELNIPPALMAVAMVFLSPKKAIKHWKKSKHIKKQANEIKNSLNNGKNSVTVKTGNGQVRYDLDGKAHGGIDTPHKQTYKNNVVDGEVKSTTRTSKYAEPMTQEDIRTVKKVLNKRKDGSN